MNNIQTVAAVLRAKKQKHQEQIDHINAVLVSLGAGGSTNSNSDASARAKKAWATKKKKVAAAAPKRRQGDNAGADPADVA